MEIRYELTSWFVSHYAAIDRLERKTAHRFFDGVVAALAVAGAEALRSGLGKASVGGVEIPSNRMGVDYAINAPTGHLAQGLFAALYARKPKVGQGLSSDIRRRLETLMALPDEGGWHPLTIATQIHLRSRLATAKEITVHRLLWEYGRDSFGERAAGRSFSEAEWREWLREIAENVRKGVVAFSQRALVAMTARPDLTQAEVMARLSDILDSPFSQPSGISQFSLQPALVAHALALALIGLLESCAATSFVDLESQLNSWFDPITGMDQRAEILRAAASIEIERNCPSGTAILGTLVTAWLQTQNIPDEHRAEIVSLAANIVPGLLDAIEFSTATSQTSARHWATKALLSLPKERGVAFDQIIERSARWISIINMEMYPHMMKDNTYKESRRKRFDERIGRHAPGTLVVLAVPMVLEELDDETLPDLVPILLDGYPLAPAVKCFEAAAVVLAVRGHFDAWKGLKWLCELNEIDPETTAEALRALSNDFLKRVPEAGVIPTLRSRAAGLALCLSGYEADEIKCGTLTPIADGMFD